MQCFPDAAAEQEFLSSLPPFPVGAKQDAHDLARARLLTVRGYGHTEIANPSTCATNYELSYLQTGALPPAGTTCQQDGTPFPAP